MVGCGFVARRDAFPMPCDTLTEDHDFTMQVQSGLIDERSFDVSTLHERSRGHRRDLARHASVPSPPMLEA